MPSLTKREWVDTVLELEKCIYGLVISFWQSVWTKRYSKSLGCTPPVVLLQFPSVGTLPCSLLCPCRECPRSHQECLARRPGYPSRLQLKEKRNVLHGNASGPLSKENKAVIKEITQGCVFTQSTNHGIKWSLFMNLKMGYSFWRSLVSQNRLSWLVVGVLASCSRINSPVQLWSRLTMLFKYTNTYLDINKLGHCNKCG